MSITFSYLSTASDSFEASISTLNFPSSKDPSSLALLGSRGVFLLEGEDEEEEEEEEEEAVGRVFFFFDLLSTTIPFLRSSFAFIFIMTTNRALDMSGMYL